MADFPNAMSRSCNSAACRNAVQEIQTSADASVMPCHDFYLFACGKWNTTSKSSPRLTYNRFLEAEFLDLVDAKLTETSGVSAARKIGNVYSSCVAFHVNRSTDLGAMFSAAKIDTERWLGATDYAVLIEMIVESILTNHLESILSIVYHRNGTVDVRIGTGIDAESLFSLRQVMMKEAENLPGNDWYRAQMDKMNALNEGIMAIVGKYFGIDNPLVSVKSEHFDKSPVARWFAKPLAKHAKSAHKRAPAQLRYPDDSSMLQLLDRIQAFDVKVVALYALYVPFAEFINFERETAVLRGHSVRSEVCSVCANFVHLLFKDTLHSVIAASTGASQALPRINAMWKRLQEVSSRHPEAGGLRLKEDPVPRNAAVLLHGHFDDSEKMPEGALEGAYGGDFLLNLITYTRNTGVLVPVEPANSWSADDVDPKLFRPPYFYPDATEPFVNYATVGVKVAEHLFLRSVPKEALTSTEVMSCFATFALSHMNLTIQGMHWTHYAGLTWAVEAALDAALGAARHGRSAHLERFMFVRFAQAYCGEPQASRKTLIYVVRSSKTFAKAFACTMPPYPNCGVYGDIARAFKV
ncbi:hypothetical protein V5799_023013 [Amblyomma americanum]|uniref:Uncharacterized protein n=1 Tax=Amblyomma americanum TaxID=6943 RepID=A0AAQ4FIV7_AMBAM